MKKLASAAFAAVVGTILAGALSPAGGADRAAGLARMAGVWQLDTRVSDDPLREVRSAARSRPRGGDDGDEGLGRLEERLEELSRGVGVLTISFDDPRLTITYWDDRQRVLELGGKRVIRDGVHGPVRVKAEWGSSDRLIVKTTGDPAGKLVEVFELGGRGEKLFVTLELYRQGTRRRFSFQRLYNRVDAGG